MKTENDLNEVLQQPLIAVTLDTMVKNEEELISVIRSRAKQIGYLKQIDKNYEESLKRSEEAAKKDYPLRPESELNEYEIQAQRFMKSPKTRLGFARFLNNEFRKKAKCVITGRKLSPLWDEFADATLVIAGSNMGYFHLTPEQIKWTSVVYGVMAGQMLPRYLKLIAVTRLHTKHVGSDIKALVKSEMEKK